MRAYLDPGLHHVERHRVRDVELAVAHVGTGGVPLLLVHGWPETKRIWWRVAGPLAEAGFEVVAPDLRGFGDSEVGPDGLHDTVASSLDLAELLDTLGLDRVVLVGGDFGGVIAQDLAARFPDRIDRLVLFNCPMPYLKGQMDGLRTRPVGTIDYFMEQALRPDELIEDLANVRSRRRYLSTFYSSRLWAHPGAFDDEEVTFHVEPFDDPATLRASFGAYVSTFDESARTAPSMLGQNPDVRTLLLYGPSDHVIPPDWEAIARIVFPDHVGPYRIEGAGHFLPWEQPEIFANAIVSFCSDLLAAR